MLVVPTLGIVVGWVVAELVAELDVIVAELEGESIERVLGATAGSVQVVTAAVATAMLTFMGVVFALTILALQMASSQFSPRVMRTFVRSRMTKWTMGTFMATFTYAIVLLAYIEPGNDEVAAFLPAIAFGVLLIGVFACLFLFVAYVNHVVRLVRVGQIINRITMESRLAIDQALVVPGDLREVAAPDLTGAVSTVTAERSGVLGGVDLRSMARLGERHDCTLELRVRIGDFVADGGPLVTLHGTDAPPIAAVRRTVFVDTERTMFEDPAFGLRQLVDIASRALSPGVNDPTTAVQAIDRIGELLSEIGHRADPPAHWLGPGGAVRVVRPVHDWDAFVRLAYTEVRRYGSDAPQVARRTLASLNDLLEGLPDHRHPPLLEQRRLLGETVAAEDLPEGDRTMMSVPDRSGIG